MYFFSVCGAQYKNNAQLLLQNLSSISQAPHLCYGCHNELSFYTKKWNAKIVILCHTKRNAFGMTFRGRINNTWAIPLRGQVQWHKMTFHGAVAKEEAKALLFRQLRTQKLSVTKQILWRSKAHVGQQQILWIFLLWVGEFKPEFPITWGFPPHSKLSIKTGSIVINDTAAS